MCMFFFLTYQFEFHILNHRSLQNMNKMLDYHDLFDKFHDYIATLHMGQLRPQLEKQ
jgi:hypothetical protein